MPLSPSLWHQERVPGAVIQRDMDPDPPDPSNNSAYAPFPLRRASDGRVLCYVKEESPEYRLVLFDSADGEAFTHVGTALGAGATGTWDAGGVSEPTGYYDEAAGTIHLLYKGWGASQAKLHTGYATAAASTPTSFTRQNGGDPILDMETVAAELGIPVVLNSYLWSEDPADAAWAAGGVAVSFGASVTAPDGTATAKLVIPTTTNVTNHRIEQALPALADGAAQSVDLYARAGGYSWLRIYTISKANTAENSWVNCATGAVGTKAAGHTLTVTADEHGFYRITLVWNAGSGATAPRLLLYPNPGNGSAAAFAGDGVSGVYLWGLQLRKDSSAPFTHYVPTTTAAVSQALGVYDHGTSCVLRVGSEWRAYGYLATAGDGYRIYYASGASLTALTAQAVVLSPPAGYDMVFAPAVFRHPTAAGYCMVYTQGVEIGSQSRYHLRSAWSADGVAWTPFRDWFSIPGGWSDQSGFEGRHYAGRFLMEGQDDFDRPLAYPGSEALLFYFSVSGGGDKTALLRVRTEGRADEAAELRNTLTIHRNAAPSLPTSTWTAIPFNQRVLAVLDDMIQLDAATLEQTDVTIRESGLYHLGFWLSFAAHAVGSRQAYLVVNNIATPIVDVAAGHLGVETVLRASCIHPLVGGDVLQLRCWQDSGGSLALTLVNMFPTLGIRRIAE